MASLGSLALGSRLKRLSDHMMIEVEKAYETLGIDLQPRFFPYISFLNERGPSGITEISKSLEVSHPAISQMTNKMIKTGMVSKSPDPTDERRQLVSLTDQGKVLVSQLQPLWPNIREVVDELLERSESNILQDITRLEEELSKQSMSELILQKLAEQRPSDTNFKIVGWDPAYKEDFRRMNEEWIVKYFKMEEPDEAALGCPEQYYLAKGGHIFFARQDGKTVGCCGLARRDAETFELCKLAVEKDYRKHGIARQLMAYVVQQAELLQARRVVLESNRVLIAALHLYRSIGFVEVPAPSGGSSYERADIFMELTLPQS